MSAAAAAAAAAAGWVGGESLCWRQVLMGRDTAPFLAWSHRAFRAIGSAVALSALAAADV